MLRQTLRSLAAHKRRFVATAVAVVLGVAFMSGTLVLTSTMQASFDGLFADLNDGTDAYVRADGEIGGDRDRLDLSIVDTVATVDGVAALAPVVEGYAHVVGPDGKAVEPTNGAPPRGVAWITDPGISPYTVVDGAPPVSGTEVVIDEDTADTTGFGPGDQVTVLTQAGATPFTVSGVIALDSDAGSTGGSVVGFSLDAAMTQLSTPGRIDAVAVAAADGVEQSDLAARLDATLPAYEVLTGAELTAEHRDEVREAIGFLTTFLLAFALIALFVGAFIINNTFSIVVAQRTKELALLRALGAGRGQIMASVVGEAVLVGVIASAVGLGAGIALAEGLEAVFASIGLEIAGATVITASSMTTPFVLGVVVCLLSSIMPARKATTVPPVAAMRDVTVETAGSSARRTVVGATVTLGGAAALLVGLFAGTVAAVGLGALAMIFGVRVLGPVLARPAARLLGAPAAAARGTVGRIARDNAARNPKRTAATASALMIGVALVGFASIVAASTKDAVSGAVDEAITADLVLNAGQFSPGISPTVGESIAAIPGVEAVSPIRYAPASVDGDTSAVVAYDPATVEQVMDLDVSEGSLAQLGSDGLAVQRDAAEDRGWSLGDRVEVVFPTGPAELTVVALYEQRFASGDFVIGLDRFVSGFTTDLDQQVIVRLAAGDTAATRAAIEAAVADYPTVRVMDRDEFTDEQAGQIDQFLALVYGLLGLAVLIALIGIVNTLGLSIHERTRELGLLRAVGMTRRQLRSAVRWEAVIIATFGTLLGLGLGLVFGTAAVSALGDAGIERIAVPTTQLVVIAGLGALAGVVAATLPARRAARLDVLAAISAS